MKKIIDLHIQGGALKIYFMIQWQIAIWDYIGLHVCTVVTRTICFRNQILLGAHVKFYPTLCKYKAWWSSALLQKFAAHLFPVSFFIIL